MSEGKLRKTNENPLAAAVRDALGVGPDEDVNIVTPQFERPEGWPKPVYATTEFHVLRHSNVQALKHIGCMQWSDEPDADGLVLMLFPGEWYDKIPKGFVIETINGEQKPFVPGTTSNDIRFGMLAYGVKVRP